jgi:hypothetical protein
MSEHTTAGVESRTRPDASTRLNSDDRERLQTLDGVGPVTADRLAQEFGTVGEVVRTAPRAHDGPAWQCVDRGDALARFEAVDGVGHARAERLVETIVDEWTDAGDVIQSTRVATDGGDRRTEISGERRRDDHAEQRRRVHRALGELLDADHGPHREVTVTARQVASRDERLDASMAGRWLSTLCGEDARLDDEEASAVFDVNLWSGCRSRRKWTVSQRLPDGSVDAFVGSGDREERERAQSTVGVSPPDRQNVTVTAEQALMTVVCERCRSRYAAARSECPNCRDSPEVVTDGGRPSCADCGGQPDGLDAPTRETLCRRCARQRADTRAARAVTDGGRPEPDWREDGLCSLCRDRTARTLTGDSHPQGPNITVCKECSYDAPEMSVSPEAVDRLREYCWFRSGHPVLEMVFDACPREDLTWKDWERVVRHSRGALAIRVDVGLGHDRYVGVSRHGPVVVRHDRETEIDDAPAASHYLKLAAESDSTTLWPVCAEHTPVVQRRSWSDASWHEIAADPETWAAFEDLRGESA